MVSFSTIIPVYNRVNLIEHTIESIIDEKLEIIVVDDGSTDGTVENLKQYGDRIIILQQENKGPGAARNLGITKATGDYILFLDSDDLWFTWSLNTFKQAIFQFNYPAFIAGTATRFNQESEIKSIQYSSLQIELFPDYYASSQLSLWLLNGAVAIKSEVLRQAGGFTAQWINGEDSDLWLKLGTAKQFVYIHSPPLLAYRRHPNSAVANNKKTYQGAWHMINQEKRGLYPGGKARQLERLEILMRHIRPVSLACLQEEKIEDAWQIYQATFRWNLYLKRFKYLVAFLVLLGKTYFIKLISRINGVGFRANC